MLELWPKCWLAAAGTCIGWSMPGGCPDRSSWGNWFGGGEPNWSDGSKPGVPSSTTQTRGNKMSKQNHGVRQYQTYPSNDIKNQVEDQHLNEPPVVPVQHFCKETCSQRTGRNPCDGNRCVQFFCEYCKKYHRHGVPGGISEHEHRAAHCKTKSESPYLETGYFLKLAEKDSRDLK
jgi:hypothetical protein